MQLLPLSLSVYIVTPFSILQNQWTSLIMVAREGHADVVQLLLSAGANMEVTDKVMFTIHYYVTVVFNYFVVRLIVFCRIGVLIERNGRKSINCFFVKFFNIYEQTDLLRFCIDKSLCLIVDCASDLVH